MDPVRLPADDVQVGDRIARARSHDFEEVAAIRRGPTAVRFSDPRGKTIMRPRRTAQLWVVR